MTKVPTRLFQIANELKRKNFDPEYAATLGDQMMPVLDEMANAPDCQCVQETLEDLMRKRALELAIGSPWGSEVPEDKRVVERATAYLAFLMNKVVVEKTS